MAQRKFIKSGSAATGTVNIDIPKGKHAGLVLRVKGTSAAGQTFALSDVGQIRAKRNGEEVISESFDFFHAYNDLKGGFLPTITGSPNVAEDVFCYIPFQVPELPNIVDVRTNEEMDVQIQFASAMDTVFSGGSPTYELYSYETPDIREQYQLLIREQDIQASGAGRLAEVLNGKNLMALYITDASDKIDKYSLEVDGRMVVDDIDDDVERAITGLENRVESSTTFAETNLVRTGNYRNAINAQSKLGLTFNASGTITVTAFQWGKSLLQAEAQRVRR